MQREMNIRNHRPPEAATTHATNADSGHEGEAAAVPTPARATGLRAACQLPALAALCILWPPSQIYLIYDLGPPALHHKLAITLPAKWLEQSSDKVKECFVERYNKKFPEYPLDDEELVLCIKDESPFTNKQYKYLTSSDTPAACFTSGMDVRLVPPEKKAAPGMTASGKLRCKNFGCQCEYDEADNKEGACRHHVEPPVFHDTRKWWSCCEGAQHASDESSARSLACCSRMRTSEPPPPLPP